VLLLMMMMLMWAEGGTDRWLGVRISDPLERGRPWAGDYRIIVFWMFCAYPHHFRHRHQPIFVRLVCKSFGVVKIGLEGHIESNQPLISRECTSSRWKEIIAKAVVLVISMQIR
jgi:hypothetical protein